MAAENTAAPEADTVGAASIHWEEVSPGVGVAPDADAPALLALAGAFVYFDVAGAICAINAISNLLDASQEEVAALIM